MLNVIRSLIIDCKQLPAQLEDLKQLADVVVEEFVKVFLPQATVHDSAAAGGNSYDEARIAEAIQMVRSFYDACSSGSPKCNAVVRRFVTNHEHHPTAALFLQHTLEIALPLGTSSKQRIVVGASDRLEAIAMCTSIVRCVGRETNRMLFPGLASCVCKYLAAFLPSHGTHNRPLKHSTAAMTFLTECVQQCFDFPSVVMEVASGESCWESAAIAKLLPLVLLFGGPSVTGERLCGAPLQLGVGLRDFLRVMVQLTSRYHPKGSEGNDNEVNLVASYIVMRDVCASQGESSLEGDDVLLARYSDDLLLSFVAGATPQQHDNKESTAKGNYLRQTSLVTFAVARHLLVSSSKSVARTSLTRCNVLWPLLHRCVRFTSNDWATGSVGGGVVAESAFCHTPSERRGKELPQRTNSKYSLIDGFYSAVMHALLAADGDEELDSFLDECFTVLDDWEAYALHPSLLYALGRMLVLGMLPLPFSCAPTRDQAKAAKRRCQEFFEGSWFERFWDLMALEHLWGVELDATDCSFQQLCHRSAVACSLLGVIQSVAEVLISLARPPSDSPMPAGATRRTTCVAPQYIRRFVVLTVYNVLEKCSCSLPGVKERAEAAVRSLCALECGEGANAIDFFTIHSKFVVDEAQRALRDPDLTASATQVLLGFTKLVGASVRQIAADHISRDSSTVRSGVHPPCVTSSTDTIDSTDKCAASTAVAGQDETRTCDVKWWSVEPFKSRIASCAVFLREVLEVCKGAMDTSHTAATFRQAIRNGVMSVVQRVVAVTGTLVFECSDLQFPSEEDWDDERKFTSTNPFVAELQERLHQLLLTGIIPSSLVTGVSYCARAIPVAVGIVKLFTDPTRSPPVIIRTHLTTLHQLFQPLLNTLQTPMGLRRDEAVGLLSFSCKLIDADKSKRQTLAPGSKRTLLTTLQSRGRWLASLSIPLEIAAAVDGLHELMALAPSFMAPRMSDEVAPVVLVWYVRAKWLSSVSGRREEMLSTKCVGFLRGVVATAEACGVTDLGDKVKELCRGTVSKQHWHELYGDAEPLEQTSGHDHEGPIPAAALAPSTETACDDITPIYVHQPPQ